MLYEYVLALLVKITLKKSISINLKSITLKNYTQMDFNDFKSSLFTSEYITSTVIFNKNNSSPVIHNLRNFKSSSSVSYYNLYSNLRNYYWITVCIPLFPNIHRFYEPTHIHIKLSFPCILHISLLFILFHSRISHTFFLMKHLEDLILT